jgi:hypothetical protein
MAATPQEIAATAPGLVVGAADSRAASLRRVGAETLRQLTDLYLALQPRDLRRSIPTVSRALGWDWSRIGPDLLDRLDDEALYFLAAVAFDRLAELAAVDPDGLADVDVDDPELRRRVLEQLRHALA